MLNINISHQAEKFLKKVHPKHGKQLAVKIIELRKNPYPQDSKILKGELKFLRADSGEYRIVYKVHQDTLEVLLVGKRNDDEVYKKFKRKV
ncbi:type II toxin-antitoxin system RelE/ParE family toxin [Candidatus Peregrinibacteria bacterium]|nr:type II toxin-antitoxin system RelE/ParE family toxin [Candidatus Peregrinibacteria bacterium]